MKLSSSRQDANVGPCHRPSRMLSSENLLRQILMLLCSCVLFVSIQRLSPPTSAARPSSIPLHWSNFCLPQLSASIHLLKAADSPSPHPQSFFFFPTRAWISPGETNSPATSLLALFVPGTLTEGSPTFILQLECSLQNANHVTPLVKTLHWLPISLKIKRIILNTASSLSYFSSLI